MNHLLNQLQAQVKTIQKKSKSKMAIRYPEEFWNNVVKLSHHYPPRALAESLNISYYHLKKKIKSQQIPNIKDSSGPQLVEILPSKPKVELTKKMVLELTLNSGSIVRVFE